LIESSDAVPRPQFYLRPLIPLLSGLVLVALAFSIPALLSGILPHVPILMVTVVFLRPSILTVLLRSRRILVDCALVTDPLVIAYPTRTRWTRGHVWGVIVGIFEIIGAIVAVTVIFYSPK